MIATLFLAVLLQIKVPDAAQIIGQPQGTPITGPQLERRTMEISSELRCPVCQGLAIGDSPSIMAANLKAQVRELLERGYNEPPILSYFEKSYGGVLPPRPQKPPVPVLPRPSPPRRLVLVGAPGQKRGRAPGAAAAA